MKSWPLALLLIAQPPSVLAQKFATAQAAGDLAAAANEAMFPQAIYREMILRLAREEFNTSFEQFAENREAERQYPGLRDAAWRGALPVMTREMDAIWAARNVKQEQLIRQNFTVKEQEQLVAFFLSPAGRKLIENSVNNPEVAKAGRVLGEKTLANAPVSVSDIDITHVDPMKGMTPPELRTFSNFAQSSAGKKYMLTAKQRQAISLEFSVALVRKNQIVMDAASKAAEEFVAEKQRGK